MRLLVCGVDAEGRSCLVSNTELDFTPINGSPTSGVSKLFQTEQCPPPACPPGQSKFTGGMLPPGHVSWFVIDHKPYDRPKDAQTFVHYRNAIDLLFVAEGGGDMILGDGAHPVQVGDCLVMPGSDHGFRSGPNGCRLVSFAIGTPLS